jgi:acyl carrier protein
LTDKTELKKLIIDAIKDVTLKLEDIGDDTELVSPSGLFFDSVDILDLIVKIEKRYGIKIKDNDIIKEKFRTFETFYNFLNDNEK